MIIGLCLVWVGFLSLIWIVFMGVPKPRASVLLVESLSRQQPSGCLVDGVLIERGQHIMVLPSDSRTEDACILTWTGRWEVTINPWHYDHILVQRGLYYAHTLLIRQQFTWFCARDLWCSRDLCGGGGTCPRDLCGGTDLLDI